MKWWGWAILIVAALASLWSYLGSQGRGRNRSRYDLQDIIRALLILRHNGGYMNVRHRLSGKYLRVYRETGEDADVMLMVRVPVPDRTLPTHAHLEKVLEMQGLSFTHQASPVDGLAIPVRVPDICAVDAGAAAARVAHLILDSWGLGPEDKLDLRLEGQGSYRGMRLMREGRRL